MTPRQLILSLLLASTTTTTTPTTALSILQDKRRAIVVDLSRCPNPTAAQPNIHTIATSPTIDASLCGPRDPSAFCADAAAAQIEFSSSPDRAVYTFRVPLVYDSAKALVWLQEQAFPQYWDDPVRGVGGTLVDLEREGVSEAVVRARGVCPGGEACHEAEGFGISSVYFQTKEGGVIGADRAGVTRSEDPYERLIIEYC
ncbi:hypothetical protein SLS56_010664 [Neofusicoccum ribis]|uniref:Ecp2 effector protein domain-containing protein n=1 Tax=Neofusicoccum ribis TaxID=45134 RepID=A0ABR3SEH0_9PEZI